ncbi:MAG: M1 family metallopeptidase [Clostridia bacterium]|nr:M1 family metallopeptidase [Clostridia bacterium]
MKRTVCLLLAAVLCFGLCFVLVGCGETANANARYEINVEYLPETATLAGTAKVEYVNNTSNALDELKFNLFPNAYREDAAYQPVSPAYNSVAYYNGKDYGSMVVSSVNGSKGWEVMGEDANILCVELERSVYPGDKVTLDIGFLTKLAKVNHRTGVTEKTVNLGNFYPVLCAYDANGFYECPYYSDGDPFVTECADYTVKLTLPKEYEVAATGETLGERTLERKKVHTMSATNVRDFAIVVSDSFKTEECRWGNVGIKYYYYDDAAPAAHLALIKECLDYYSESFGEYPYSTYSVVQTGFCYGGMEYPALAMISDSLKEEELVYTLAHETAHQWWYAAVGSNQAENAWQDEGLAEYSSFMFFKEHDNYGVDASVLVVNATKEYRAYYDVYSRVFGDADTRMTRHLKDYLSDYEYRCIAYDKGLIMFDSLEKSIGDKKFLTGLKNYYKACKFKLAEPADMIAAFEKAGVDVAGFFESFLSGKAVI